MNTLTPQIGLVVFVALLLAFIVYHVRRHKRRVNWLYRYATRVQDRSNLSFEDAMLHAEASLCNLCDDLDEDPVQAADDDMTCWSE